MPTTWYDILSIPTNASDSAIKNAFKKLAKQYHPDKNPGSIWHEEQFKKINQAYQILSDPKKKKQYDLTLYYQQNPTTQTQAPTSNTAKTSTKAYQPSNTPPYKESSPLKIYSFVAAFFIVIGIGSYFLNKTMNRYSAEEAVKKAEAMERMNRPKQAFLLYTDALQFDDTYAIAYEKRAGTRISAIKDYNGAIYDYTNAIVHSEKENPTLYFKRGIAYIVLEDYSKGCNDMNKAASLGYSEANDYLQEYCTKP
jgi:curved DNA-binding protein CbpA